MQELIFSGAELSAVAARIIASCSDIQVITLSGTLGAGKTTLAIELLRQLGVVGETQSPTYTYMQMYRNADEKNFYHFDVYRLKNKEEFLFAGFDEFLYQSNSLAIIEWPEIIESLLHTKVCVVKLEYVDDMRRKISWYVK